MQVRSNACLGVAKQALNCLYVFALAGWDRARDCGGSCASFSWILGAFQMLSRSLIPPACVLRSEHTSMRMKFHPAGLMLVLMMLGALTSHAAPQDPKSQIRAEIERLTSSLKERPIADADYAPIATIAGQSLNAAGDALDSGNIYLSLEKLLQAEDSLQGARFPVERTEIVKSSLPAFEAEWKKVSQTINGYDQELRQKDWGTAPAAVRALSETALGRSTPLLEGGYGFAVSTKPSEGLFYLGQAQGEVAFAQFVSSLGLVRNGEPFPLRSVLPELQKLQEKTNAAFQPPRSIQLHDRFIALNSTLKLAEELDAQKFYAGAVYQYLEAVRHYGMLDAPVIETASQASLKDAIVAARKKLAASKQDDSIAELFLERAGAQIAHTDRSAAIPDEWRSAKVILDQVLPAYSAAKVTLAPVRRTTAKTVQLTLVRWPYT